MGTLGLFHLEKRNHLLLLMLAPQKMTSDHPYSTQDGRW
jgi:hypothetical protein